MLKPTFIYLCLMKIAGLGNALVDILIPLQDDHFLAEHGLPRGSMQLIDFDRAAELQRLTRDFPRSQASGGSAANTIHGIARLGVDTCYIGKIGNDPLGKFFHDDMRGAGINPVMLPGIQPTGTAITFISPDSERTFGTYLGAATEMIPSDILPEHFRGYDLIHIEGYMVFNRDLAVHVVQLAKQQGMLVSLDLSSYNVVEANRDFLHSMIRDFTDIVFANEEEAKAFTGESPESALGILAELCDTAVVKVGKQGSLIQHQGHRCNVGVVKANVHDTTGAGDLYASGFLYGLSKHLSPEKCGTLGSMVAGAVIEEIGAKISPEKWPQLKAAAEAILF
jgi:sugar/nucleoside kinase (ribokinase family)